MKNRTGTLRAWLATATLFAAATGCGGGSSSTASTSDGGPDASDAGASSDVSIDSTATESGAERGGDANVGNEAGIDTGAEAGSGAEPGYLRNSATAGFAYTANFGSPYDSILGAPLNTTQSALAPGWTPQPAAGQSSGSQSFQLIASSADLYSALNISASLSVSTGLASVNAKTAFAQSTQIDSTDLWVLADFQQVGGAQEILNPSLSAQAAALSPQDFYTLYGDRYAAEIVTGSEMFCTLRIHTYSQQDKSSLTASLGFSYGASSGSVDFSSMAMSATANHTANVSCEYLGFSPTTVVTDLPSLLTAGNAFASGSAKNVGSVGTSTLYLIYTSYYGIPGYPGVPAGTAALVAQQGQLASDYLLYNSLVQNDFSAYYADPAYNTLPFFAHMKAYRDGLSSYLKASVISSQNPGVAVPSPSADGVISNWLPIPGVSSQAGATPQFATYALSNGIVPKRISDYAIPLRYAYPDSSGNGTLNVNVNGALKQTSFAPVSPIPPAASAGSTAPVAYQLYLVNKPGAGGLWLEYEWDTGTYFFPNVTTSGAPSPALINAAIKGVVLQGNGGASYVVVNKSNGLAMTDNTAAATPSPNMTASHFSSGSQNQLWEFWLDAGTANNCKTYVAPSGPAGNSCAIGNNGVNTINSLPPCGSLIYGISAYALSKPEAGYWQVTGAAGSPIASNGGGGCSDCNWNCGNFSCPNTSCGGGPVPWDDFFLQPYDMGSTQAIYNYAGSQGGTVTYAVLNGNAVVASQVVNGSANQLWVFIPSANVDATP